MKIEGTLCVLELVNSCGVYYDLERIAAGDIDGPRHSADLLLGLTKYSGAAYCQLVELPDDLVEIMGQIEETTYHSPISGSETKLRMTAVWVMSAEPINKDMIVAEIARQTLSRWEEEIKEEDEEFQAKMKDAISHLKQWLSDYQTDEQIVPRVITTWEEMSEKGLDLEDADLLVKRVDLDPTTIQAMMVTPDDKDVYVWVRK